MGVSGKFIEFIKFIKVGRIFYLLLLFLLILPGFVNGQDNSNDTPVTSEGKKYYRHTVIKGETIYGIAEKFNILPKDIVLENPSAIDGINPGDVLLIPAVSKPGDTSSAKKIQQKQTSCIYHEVLKKETLYSLAKRYNTTISAIDSLNPELAGKSLQKGQTIRIAVVQPTSAQIPKTSQPEPKPELSTSKNEVEAYKSLIKPAPIDTSKIASLFNATGNLLNRYSIALIMPFASAGPDSIHLSRLLDGSEQIPLTTSISVDFYHGIIMAFDSLSKKGLKVNMYIYNILPGSDSTVFGLDSILKKPEMFQMNLIIGPPFPSNFKKAELFAALHQIPIVSPLSGENSVLNNNLWTSKATPSAITETEAEADYIVSNYRNTNLIVVHNKDANDAYYKAFRKQFIKSDSAFGGMDTLRLAESAGGVAGLKSKMIRSAVNVVVVPYQEPSYVAKFVNEFANSKIADENSIVLFGMHNWAKNDALDPSNLDTLNCHFPSNEFVNYDDLPTKKFIVKYRNNYLAEPSYYAYEGYDDGMFYGNLLLAFGTNIQGHLGDTKYRGLQTSFDMSHTNPANGYENKAVYILEYVNYTEKVDWR
jgi:LysM repeat protein